MINGSYYRGGVLAFSDIALLWDVNKMEDLTPESLHAVTLFNPPISKYFPPVYDIQLGTLFIGTGKNTEPIPSSVIAYLHNFGISVESMNTV